MRTLVIVESPSKCKKIEEYLGPSYKVVASCGHITSFSSLDQLNMETYEVNYKIEKPTVVKMLKSEIKQATEIIIATDDDREGEAIGWHICKVCKLNVETTPRILFSEITKEAIENAIQHKGLLNMNRVYSQQTRQILDLYIGFTISPKLWKYILNKLSAGRCQTPALHMIYEKEKDYEQQSMDTHYKVEGWFTAKLVKFHLSQCMDKVDDFLEQCKSHKFEMYPIEKHSTNEKRPSILITSSLQQKAHQVLGYSPSQTMSYAQALYEHGCITYMRTDTPSYNDTFKQSLELHIKQHFGDDYYKEIPSSTKKAHEGIRVTNLKVTETTFETSQINKLYKLIYIHTLQTSMSDAKIETSHYKISAPFDLYFIYKEPMILFEGWKKVNSTPKHDSLSLYLSQLRQINYSSIVSKEILQKPMYHYCEAQLIQKLEKESIGRPSTYASILTKLYDKHYIVKGKIKGKVFETTQYELIDNVITKKSESYSNDETNKITITNTGKKVVEFCYQYYNHLFDYAYTNKMETQLDIIEETGLWRHIFTEFKREVDQEVVIDMVKSKQSSLHCGTYKKHPVVIKSGQFGYYMEYKKVTTSLIHWIHYDQIEEFIEEQTFPNELMESLMNINVLIGKHTTIRKGKTGDYIYHKTPQMKKPKFYALDIDSRNVEDIKEYLQKKYNLII